MSELLSQIVSKERLNEYKDIIPLIAQRLTFNLIDRTSSPEYNKMIVNRELGNIRSYFIDRIEKIQNDINNGIDNFLETGLKNHTNEKIEELIDDIRNLSVTIVKEGEYFSQLYDRLEEENEKRTDSESRNVELSLLIGTLKSNNNSLTGDNERLRKRLRELQNELKKGLPSSKYTIELLESQCETDKKELTSQIYSLKNTVDNLNKKIGNLKHECKKLELEFEKEKTEDELEDEKFKDLSNKYREQLMKGQECENEIRELRSIIDSSRNRIINTESENENLKRDLELSKKKEKEGNVNEVTRQYEEQLKKLEGDNKNLKSECEKKENILIKTKNEAKGLEKKVEEVRNKYLDNISRISKLEKDKTKLEIKAEEKEEKIEDLERDIKLNERKIKVESKPKDFWKWEGPISEQMCDLFKTCPVSGRVPLLDSSEYIRETLPTRMVFTINNPDNNLVGIIVGLSDGDNISGREFVKYRLSPVIDDKITAYDITLTILPTKKLSTYFEFDMFDIKMFVSFGAFDPVRVTKDSGGVISPSIKIQTLHSTGDEKKTIISHESVRSFNINKWDVKPTLDIIRFSNSIKPNVKLDKNKIKNDFIIVNEPLISDDLMELNLSFRPPKFNDNRVEDINFSLSVNKDDRLIFICSKDTENILLHLLLDGGLRTSVKINMKILAYKSNNEAFEDDTTLITFFPVEVNENTNELNINIYLCKQSGITEFDNSLSYEVNLEAIGTDNRTKKSGTFKTKVISKIGDPYNLKITNNNN
jgi:hypothetical protein